MQDYTAYITPIKEENYGRKSVISNYAKYHGGHISQPKFNSYADNLPSKDSKYSVPQQQYP